MDAKVSIRQADSPTDIEIVSHCFRTYTEWLGEDLTHQGYAAEFSSLPGKYASPRGALLLATDPTSDSPLGCIAMRPIDLPSEHPVLKDGVVRCCEVKRLFVFPEARGRQVARKLVKEIIQRAGQQGYEYIFLDSLSRMEAAIRLYQSEGFVETAAYNDSPLQGTVYYAKRLGAVE